VLAFDNVVERPPALDGEGLVAASDRNRFRAVEFLSRMDARGGTEMAEPLRQAVDRLTGAPAEERARDRVLVLVTDGQVGNEDQLIGLLGPRLGEVRVFTVGVDVAVNEAFLKRLAGLGGGACELVESEDRLDAVMERIHRRVGTPVLTDLVVEDAGLGIEPDSLTPSAPGRGSGGLESEAAAQVAGGQAEPSGSPPVNRGSGGLKERSGSPPVGRGSARRLPVLFAGTPLVVTGRLRGRPGAAASDGALVVRGRLASGREWRAEVPARPADNPALAAVWARGRLRDLEDAHAAGRGADQELERRIVATSLRFGVLCRFTAFVAVDNRVVNEGGRLRRVAQPVDAPQGWDMFGPSPVGAGVAGAVMAAPAATDRSRVVRRAAPAGGMVRPLLAKASPVPLPGRRAAAPVVVPLDAYRRRARELRARFAEAGEGERAGRLAGLRRQLGELLDDLRSVGAPAEELRPLDELLAELARLDGERLAGAEVLAGVWERALQVLDAFAGAEGVATLSGPQRGRTADFWKRPPR